MNTLNNEINDAVANAGGVWGIYSKNLLTGEVIYEQDSDLPFPSASVGKLPIAIYVFSQIEQGKVNLDDKLILKEDVVLGGSGVLQHLHTGLELTVLDVISLMFLVSDNTSAKMLVKKFTPQIINSFMESFNFETTRLKIDGDKFGYGMTTPKEMSDIFEGLYKGDYFSKELSEKLLEILKKSGSGNRLRRYLPYDKYNEELKLEVASKSGSIPGVRADVGIVFGKTPYTICILSKDLTDHSNNADNKGVLAIAAISKVIFNNIEKTS